MLGFDLRSPHRLATSSGSVNLNSPFVPSHVIDAELYSINDKNQKSKENGIRWSFMFNLKKYENKMFYLPALLESLSSSNKNCQS